MVRRMLAAAWAAVMISVVAVSPAWAAAGGPGLQPRAGQWWFSSWKILSAAWPQTQGAGVTVAVVDSGVQASVPDLHGAVLPGGDVTGRHSNGETDFNGHGTTMAVLIAGQGSGTGMAGVAPKAKILPVAVDAAAADAASGPSQIAAGIMYAANHGARVIDVSQEYPSVSASGCDAAEQKAVAYALARDIVVVAAAGDTDLVGNVPAEPASCAGVVAVSALRPSRVLWPQDARQPYITVVNPGADLVTSGSRGQLITGVSGTRPASALAAGAVALIRSRYPALPWYRVVQRLTGTALPAGGHLPNDSFGYGIFRLSYAVDATAHPVSASAPNPVYAKYQAWLATPQGRSIARQLSAPSRQPGTAQAGKGGSRAPAVIAIVAILAVAGAGMAALFLRARRRLAPRKQVQNSLLREPSEAAFPDRLTDEEGRPLSDLEYNGFASGYLLLGDQPSYRIPPYLAVPDDVTRYETREEGLQLPGGQMAALPPFRS
jgi:subtilisin family serine protease